MTNAELITFIKKQLAKEEFTDDELQGLAKEMQVMLAYLRKQESSRSQQRFTTEEALTLYLLAYKKQSKETITQLAAENAQQADQLESVEEKYKSQVVEFEKIMLEQVDAEIKRANKSLTHLQSTMGTIFSKTGAGETESARGINDKSLIHFRRVFFPEYNDYQLEIINLKEKSAAHNGLLKNKIILTLDFIFDNKPKFILNYQVNEGSAQSYQLGEYSCETALVNILRNSLDSNSKGIVDNEMILELVLRVIILKSLRYEGLLYRHQFYARILKFCDEVKGADYPSGEIATYKRSILALIEKIQRQISKANIHSHVTERKINSVAHYPDNLSRLEIFALQMKKLKKEVGTLYFILLGDFFEEKSQAMRAASSSSSSSQSLDSIRENLEIDSKFILDLYEKFDDLIQQVQLIELKRLKSSEASFAQLYEITQEKYADEKMKAKRSETLNVRALHALRVRLLPEYNHFKISVSNHEEFSRTYGQFCLIRKEDQEGAHTYHLYGIFDSENSQLTTISLADYADLQDLEDEFKEIYNNNNNSSKTTPNHTFERLIQMCIVKILDNEQLLDRKVLLNSLLSQCEYGLSLLTRLQKSDEFKAIQDDEQLEIALDLIAEIKKELPSSSFKLNENDALVSTSFDGLCSELSVFQEQIGKIGFILMGGFLKPSSSASTGISTFTWSSSSSNRPSLDEIDAQRILDLHECCRSLSQYLLLINNISKKNSTNASYKQ